MFLTFHKSSIYVLYSKPLSTLSDTRHLLYSMKIHVFIPFPYCAWFIFSLHIQVTYEEDLVNLQIFSCLFALFLVPNFFPHLEHSPFFLFSCLVSICLEWSKNSILAKVFVLFLETKRKLCIYILLAMAIEYAIAENFKT